MVHSNQNLPRISKLLPPWMVGLLVFGGTNPVSQLVESESAFEFGFSKEKNLNAWRKCGTAPLTSCFLKSCQVMIEIGDYDDATNQAMQHIQSTNDISTHFVWNNGDAFKVTMKR